MKLLLFYAHKWWFKTASKSLPDVADIDIGTENVGFAAECPGITMPGGMNWFTW